MEKVIGIIKMAAANGVISKDEADTAIARLNASAYAGYISKQDAAKEYDISPRSLDQAAQDRKLRRFHKNAEAYFLRSEVDALYGIKEGSAGHRGRRHSSLAVAGTD